MFKEIMMISYSNNHKKEGANMIALDVINRADKHYQYNEQYELMKDKHIWGYFWMIIS